MANFCTNCGKPMHPKWNFCPFCSYHAYQIPKDISQIPLEKPSFDTYQTVDTYPSETNIIEVERGKKEGLTKRQKKAIIIGVPIILAAIIIPLVSILIYQYLFPQKTILFFVDNGDYSTSYTVSTNRATLDYFEEKSHPSHSHWDPNFVATRIESYCTSNDSRIIQIADGIRSKCIDPYDSEEVINALLSFTQAIGYKEEIFDLAQYPMETIFNQGDCEDLSILFGSLVVSLGFEAIITVIDYFDEDKGEWFGHAGVCVYLNFTPTQHASYPPSHSYIIDSKDYWICETTYQGWRIGELPTFNPSYYNILAYEFIN
ncbi:MAG: hypothetical protein ACFFDN_41675 [Candidatus Hodarchaeota archaeon]